MKQLSLTLLLALGLTGFSFAASGGKEITLTGKMCCAKCCLKTADECQNVLAVEKDGKKTTYYLIQNDVSKDFHSNVCKAPQQATVTAKCEKVGDKLQLTASKIELAK